MAWNKVAAAGACLTLAVLWMFAADSAEEKRLSVYAPQATFSARVTDRENREYVDLFAVLEPLTRAKLRIEGKTAFITSGTTTAVLTEGETSVPVGARRVRFPGKVILADGRAHVPLVALPALLQEVGGLRSELHEAGRRLFVGNTQSRFTIEMKKGETPEIALSFPMRVNPNITQEGNKVRLVFRQEPVVMSGEGVNFADPQITDLHFEEKNGVAEITINGTTPLMVAFSDEGKTLVVKQAPAAPPVVVAAKPVEAAPALPAPATSETPAAMPSLPAPSPASPFPFDNVRYVVVIDPAHGGNDPGVRFNEKVLEKDVTLAYAKQLRSELQNRGIPAVLARESDTPLTHDQRSVIANAQRAALFVSLHAGQLGSGVRVYATVMPAAEPALGPFIPWERAQEPYGERSRLLARAVAGEMNARKVPARMLSAPIPPLNAIAAPAIAIEVAPPSADAPPEDLEKAAYRQSIVAAAATAIANARGKLEEMR